MSHDHERTCQCMTTHRPHPLELNAHHIHPLYLGGPDDESNIAWVCPTTHVSIHELLRMFMRDGLLTWGQVGDLYDVPVSRYAYTLAADGYRRAMAHTLMGGAA